METTKPYDTITATATAAGTFPDSSRNNNRRSRWNRHSSANDNKKIRGMNIPGFLLPKKGTVQYLIVTLYEALF